MDIYIFEMCDEFKVCIYGEKESYAKNIEPMWNVAQQQCVFMSKQTDRRGFKFA